jgi:hypothetical protein
MSELSWQELVAKAKASYSDPVSIHDILSEDEIARALSRLDEINATFSHKTSIVNRTDLSILMVATALLTVKSLLFSKIATRLHYGESFDTNSRMVHNDGRIEKTHNEARDAYLNKHQGEGDWRSYLLNTPPFDIQKGASELGISMGGRYHRLHTLAHDPILGWLFGPANIMTDTITFDTFATHRVRRNPMWITAQSVPLPMMFGDSLRIAKANRLNLPAAIVTEAIHLKSDELTKVGLPVPLIQTITPEFSSKLYREHYDALCLARDAKIIGSSAAISAFFNMLITIIHDLFRPKDVDTDLYDVRTRKILLIANTVATSSNVIQTTIMRNPKDLDIGGLLITITRLFSDTRFILRIKQEFIEQQLDRDFQSAMSDLEQIENNM